MAKRLAEGGRPAPAPQPVRVRGDGPLPASFAQERLWFEQSLAPDSAHYNEAVVLRIRGPLDVARFAEAMSEVVRRHEILRTRFEATDDGLRQIVLPPEPVTISRHTGGDPAGTAGATDPAAVDPATAEAHALNLVREAIRAPIPLDGFPLFRMVVAGIAEGDALVAFVVHHVVLDGWSAVLVFREAFAIYEALGSATPPDLPALTVQYADFAAAERAEAERGGFASDREAWMARLSGSLPLPPLPFGRHPRAAASGVGAHHPFEVPTGLADRLRTLGREEGATLFSTMGAAFALLLAHHAGADDILLAAPMTVRDRPELADVAGLFINTVLLRIEIDPAAGVRHVLAHVQSRVLEAQSRQRYPFQRLVGDLRESGAVTGQPLASVMFDLQRLPEAMNPAGLIVDYVEVDPGTSKFDLGLSVKATGGALLGTLEYASELFTADEIAVFATQYVTLLERMAADPAAPVASLLVAGERERAAIADWNRTTRPLPLHRIDDTVADMVRRDPAAPAVRFGSETLTFADLDRRAEAVAAELIRLGATAGDRVPLLLPRGVGQIVAVFACWKAGAAYVALDPHWPAARIAAALEAVGGHTVLTAAETDALVPHGLRVDVPRPSPDGRVAIPRPLEDVAYAMFTSGSTGRPRLVPVTHRALANLTAGLRERIDLGDDPLTVAMNGPLSFDTSVKQLVRLADGHVLDIVPDDVRADPPRFVAWLAERRADVLDATPLHVTALLDAGLGAGPAPSTLLVGGEAIGPDLWDRLAALPATRAFNLYGPTECTADATVAEIAGPRPTIGRPLANVTSYVVDAALEPVPIGVAGELVIGGAGVAAGYLGDAAATAARFVYHPGAGRVYRTGDRVRWLTDGTLEFAGRVDDQIKLRGHRIEPGEIEAVLRAVPGVEDAAVVAVGEGEAKRLVAYVAGGAGNETLHALPNGLRVTGINRNETDFLYEEMFEVQAYFKHGVGLDPGAVVLDVGANIGLFSLAAHFAAPGVAVHAFEPNPRVADAAVANVARYGADVTVHRHGVSRTAGEAAFTFYPGFSILSGLYADTADDRAVVESFVRKHDEAAAYDAAVLAELLEDRFRAETLAVPLETLSAVIAREGLTRVDLLKINVEKAEEDVLAGIAPADWPKIAQVALEVHDLDGRLARVVALLEGVGFTVAVERDWRLEDDAGTNFYVYARRPGLAPHAPPGPPALSPALDRAALRAHLAARLPEIMVPAEIVRLDRLPLTANGKLDRRALPAAAPSAPARTLPGTPTEERLAALWAELLKRPEVGCDDNFFALGGHSLLATRMIARIRETFGVALPIRALFDAPTIALLAREVDAAETAAAPAAPVLTADPAARHAPFPLTDIQEAYWLGRNAAFDLGNTSTRIYLELEDPSRDVDRLEEGWNRLIARHDMLRAVVEEDDRQRVLAEVPRYAVGRADLTDLRNGEVDQALARTRAAMSDTVMAPDRWPLFEIRASRLPGGHVRLHISMDALIADATSLLVLFREWAEFVAAGDFAEPAPAIGFRDYVLATRPSAGADARRRAEAYWLERLPDLPAAPQLPLATNPATIGSPTFKRRTHLLPDSAWAAFRRSAGGAGVSVSAALLAAFAEVLARWSDDPRLTVNLTTFDRAPLHPDVARLVGDFTTLTLVGIDCGEAASFAERARAVQARLWSDLDNRAFGGIDVLRALARQRKSGTAAQMPVVFTSVLDLDEEAAPTRFGDLVSSVAQTPQVWLDHQVMEWNGALVLNWDAVEEIFPPGLVDAMFAAYTGLVANLAAAPAAWSRPVGPLVPAEQLAVRERVNATDTAWTPVRLETGFLDHARHAPDRPALIEAGRTMTYGELDRRSAEISGRLAASGAAPGRLVAVLARKGWEQVAAVLGVLRSGAAYLPVDPDLPSERIAYLLEHGDVSVALIQSALEPAVAWPAGVTRIAVDRLAGEDLNGGAGDRHRVAPDNSARVDDLAYVIFTSGSTGLPKGVMVDHRAAMNTVADINARWSVGAGDRVLALSALGFDLSVYDIFGVLGAGGALVLPSPEAARDPAAWAALCRDHGVTLWNSVPALMQMLVETAEQDPAAWPASLRLVMMSGDWIPVTLPARIRALGAATEVVGLGGATEAAIWSIFHPANAVDPAAPSVPYGTPLANQTFHVLGRAMEPVPDYVAGELHIGGTGLAEGYWKDAGKTAAAFVRHPRTGERLYRTGDYGRTLPDGTIEFLGRRDAQVKVNGYRIELGEIEAALGQHPDVSAVAVSAPTDRGGHRRLVAHVVLHPGEADEIDAALAEGVLTDPVERMAFQMSRPGRRPAPEGAAVIALPGGAVDAARQAAFLARQSHRRFLDAPVPLAALGTLLASLQGIPVPGSPLPKYRYPSASSLNPVQAYLAVQPGMVEGLAGGVYHHDPLRHGLVAVSDAALAGVFPGTSRALFEAGAMAILLVGRLEAIRPLYGGLARDFTLIETGYAGQALMDGAAAVDIGLCPVGHVDEAALAAAIGVEGEIVVHAFVGGMVDPAWAAEWGRAARPAPADPADRLKAWLRRKVPAYMVPPTVVVLDALPLTANGKVDRTALALAPPPVRDVPASPAEGGALEETIAALMAEILEQPFVAFEANFFDLGANSLHLVQLHRRLQTDHGAGLALVDLFQNPTVASLAATIAAGGADALADTEFAEIDERAARSRAERRKRAASRKPREATPPPIDDTTRAGRDT